MRSRKEPDGPRVHDAPPWLRQNKLGREPGARGVVLIANVRQSTANHRAGDPNGQEPTVPWEAAERPRLLEPTPMRLRSRPSYRVPTRAAVPGLSELSVSRGEAASWALRTSYWATQACRDV